MLTPIKVIYTDGFEHLTTIGCSVEMFKRDMVGMWINFGDTEEHPRDLMRQVCNVVELKQVYN